MGEEPILREGEEYPDAYDLLLEQEEDKSGRRRLIIIIIIILLLLLLFWPVDPKTVRDQRLRARKERLEAQAKAPVGAAAYEIISGGPLRDVKTENRKGVAVGVWFYVRNVGSRPEILDYSMVALRDEFSKQYQAVANETDLYYQEKELSSPWGERVSAGQRVKALAVFMAYSGPKKQYSLMGRGFGWGSEKVKEYRIGAFETMPANPYMPPDSQRRP